MHKKVKTAPRPEYTIASRCLARVSNLSATLLIALHTRVSWMARTFYFDSYREDLEQNLIRREIFWEVKLANEHELCPLGTLGEIWSPPMKTCEMYWKYIWGQSILPLPVIIILPNGSVNITLAEGFYFGC